LPLELKELFSEWLEAHFPDRAARVRGRLSDCRDGQLYIAEWGSRMTGSGTYAELLAGRYALACRRLGLERGSAASRPLDCALFQPPAVPSGQLSLF
jgi:DNA repair photolyase